MNNFNSNSLHAHIALETFSTKLELKCLQDKFDEEYPKCPLCKKNIGKKEHLWKKFKWGRVCCGCYYNREYSSFLKFLENNAKQKFRQTSTK
jgi:hypothetical protein